MWTMINIARMCSMYLWDRHDIRGAVILQWNQPILSFIMLFMSYSNLNKHKARLAINNPRVILWTRYLTQNGLAVFAWWSLLNAMLGFGVLLKYDAGMPDPLVSTVVLTIVSLFTIIWFILQSFLLTKYMRYTLSVYTILILGLGAMFTRSYRFNDLAGKHSLLWVPHASHDLHELDPFDFCMFAHGEAEETCCHGAPCDI
ncbi:uncharacterized protein LOC115025709 [Cottoperca gobio]|uniref:Uncharacterized protein LOC115025709 n=1 Tax=Cottoperca gobio TaxID=56716 RepID=A0A6J2RXG5_COTGO|nr:uncharacterized protein LOC115025709 [Cottoperca gobio]